ncbi:MAG: SPOR domain-containing protein [Chloroflexi bacterium]|nr:SPOR domain-containing protein [Chloroflexota bacterium]
MAHETKQDQALDVPSSELMSQDAIGESSHDGNALLTALGGGGVSDDEFVDDEPLSKTGSKLTPRTAIMSHVLFIDSRRSMADAVARADALQDGLPSLLFFVTPLDIDGTPHFELYVGPAYNAMEATALKEPVAVGLERENPDDWSVREAPYAFYFGEYASALNAQGRVEALARASIPVYSLQVAYADGTTRVRVYGGAFRDEVEAEEMGRMVADADIGEMILTRRRGTVPGDY